MEGGGTVAPTGPITIWGLELLHSYLKCVFEIVFNIFWENYKPTSSPSPFPPSVSSAESWSSLNASAVGSMLEEERKNFENNSYRRFPDNFFQ